MTSIRYVTMRAVPGSALDDWPLYKRSRTIALRLGLLPDSNGCGTLRARQWRFVRSAAQEIPGGVVHHLSSGLGAKASSRREKTLQLMTLRTYTPATMCSAGRAP